MERKDFEEILVSALKELPIKFRHRMENVEIVIEDKPSKELLKEYGINPNSFLLGLYQGVPITKRGFFYTNVLPDKITIFQKNIEKIAGDEQNLRETLKKVIVHEIGHYYGLDEEEMR